MKRYERMSKEEIIEFYRKTKDCKNCPFVNKSGGCDSPVTCVFALSDYLMQPIKKKVHRYELVKSPEDVDKAYSEFNAFCYVNKQCGSCKFVHFNKRSMCFAQYLKEEIEVEYES